MDTDLVVGLAVAASGAVFALHLWLRSRNRPKPAKAPADGSSGDGEAVWFMGGSSPATSSGKSGQGRSDDPGEAGDDGGGGGDGGGD